MERKNNYLLQVQQAKQIFLKYDQNQLIEKLKLGHDEDYLYTQMLATAYRIHRSTGDIQRQEGAIWVDTCDHGECMTLLDLVCDSRRDRCLTGRWKNTADFGRTFHRSLLESRDPFAEAIQEAPSAFCRACEILGGKPVKLGDIGYAIELFDGMAIAVRFWEGDEEFPPKVHFLWDENALMYLKYETMWFAIGMLKQKIINLAV